MFLIFISVTRAGLRAGTFAVSVIATSAAQAGTARRGLWFVDVERCVKIYAGFVDDLLAEFGAQFDRGDFLHCAIVQIAQIERSERNANEPVYFQAQRFKDLAYLAILALAYRKREPDISTLFAVERCFDRPVALSVERYAISQPVERILLHAAKRPYAVAP